jgi:hypothetical protein
MNPVRVQLLYFEGCPNWTVAEERLRYALDLVGVPATIERCLVETQEEAERLQFQGSPSILLDGKDPFWSGSGSFGLTCRVYSTPDWPAGAPTLDKLVEAVKEAADL